MTSHTGEHLISWRVRIVAPGFGGGGSGGGEGWGEALLYAAAIKVSGGLFLRVYMFL